MRFPPGSQSPRRSLDFPVLMKAPLIKAKKQSIERETRTLRLQEIHENLFLKAASGEFCLVKTWSTFKDFPGEHILEISPSGVSGNRLSLIRISLILN